MVRSTKTNLESQRSNPDHSDRAHAAPDTASKPSDRSHPPERSKTRLRFKTNDFVVYPAHGIGQILAIEEQTVAGTSLEFFVIYFAKTKMTLRLPLGKVANAGMREPSDPAAIEQARLTLSQAPYKARGNWPRLAQEYESRINSGDIIAIATVMRDLYRPAGNPEQSYSERQLYAAALDRLASEVALVQGISEKQAVSDLESLVIAGAGRRV